uniref:Tektin n=1 Tax=Trichobilharzia regenti TaxID=157069 RepID=A0AA85JG90_TRIRE|nr:unnamed protein product [Trichobilharzia regenti]
MYCGDTETIEKRVIPPTDPACIPELVYSANDGLPTGLSMVGFHSSKYAPHESDKITRRRYEQTDTDVNISERTRNDNQDLIKQTEAVTTRSLEATTKLLKERLADTNFWKTELEREIKDIIKATDKLVRMKNDLERSVIATDDAMHICTDNINARRRRYGEDLQQDHVELQLIKELDILNKGVELYKKAIQQCENQIKRNRDAKQDLEMIWSDKLEASELLSKAGHLGLYDTNKQFYAGEARRHPLAAQSTVDSWAQHTHDAILRSEHERMATEELWTVLSNLIIDVTTDITQQKDTVNSAFQNNLSYLESQLADYKKRLKENLNEIVQMENSVKDLRRAIAEKDNNIKLVQTRLHLHNQRPGVENARDPPQQSMLDELATIQKTVDDLRDQLVVSENRLKNLQDDQMILEKQIQMKQNSIQIDHDHCVNHRMVYPNVLRLQGK